MCLSSFPLFVDHGRSHGERAFSGVIMRFIEQFREFAKKIGNNQPGVIMNLAIFSNLKIHILLIENIS
jgi:hypothetical protein